MHRTPTNSSRAVDFTVSPPRISSTSSVTPERARRDYSQIPARGSRSDHDHESAQTGSTEADIGAIRDQVSRVSGADVRNAPMRSGPTGPQRAVTFEGRISLGPEATL